MKKNGGKKPRDTAPLRELNYFVLHVGQLWLWWKKEFLAAAAAYTEGQRPKKNWGSSLWRTGKLLYSKDQVEIREPLKKHLTVTNRILFSYSGQCCSLLILYKYILCITKLDFSAMSGNCWALDDVLLQCEMMFLRRKKTALSASSFLFRSGWRVLKTQKKYLNNYTFAPHKLNLRLIAG